MGGGSFEHLLPQTFKVADSDEIFWLRPIWALLLDHCLDRRWGNHRSFCMFLIHQLIWREHFDQVKYQNRVIKTPPHILQSSHCCHTDPRPFAVPNKIIQNLLLFFQGRPGNRIDEFWQKESLNCLYFFKPLKIQIPPSTVAAKAEKP